jgi:hypothetical protein
LYVFLNSDIYSTSLAHLILDLESFQCLAKNKNYAALH